MSITRFNREKIIEKEIKSLYPNFEDYSSGTINFEEDQLIIRLEYYIQTIANQEILNSFATVFHKEIENRWLEYSNELLIQRNILYPTISINSFNLGLGDNITKTSIVISHMNNEELKEFIKHLFGTIYKEKIEYYRSLKNCDNTLNKSIGITEDVKKMSNISGLPFRKVLLAEATRNPNLPKIKDAMRTYCDEQYEIGKKENFEKLMRLKPVFEKMFG